MDLVNLERKHLEEVGSSTGFNLDEGLVDAMDGRTSNNEQAAAVYLEKGQVEDGAVVTSIEPETRLEVILPSLPHHEVATTNENDLEAVSISSPGNQMVNQIQAMEGFVDNNITAFTEQTEIVEQWLVGRNKLLQRWEEVLDRMDMPSYIRSAELDDRIEWFRTALGEAQRDRDSYRQELENLVESFGSLMIDLEEARKKIYDLESTISNVVHEKEILMGRLENLTLEQDEILNQAVQDEVDKETFKKELILLQQKMHEEKISNNEYCVGLENEIRALEEKIYEQKAFHDDYQIRVENDMKALQEKMQEEKIASSQYCIDLQNEIRALQEKVAEQKVFMDNYQMNIENETRRFGHLICDFFQDKNLVNRVTGVDNFEHLGQIIESLLDYCAALHLEISAKRDVENEKEYKRANDIDRLCRLINDSFPHQGMVDIPPDGPNMDQLDGMIKGLLNSYMVLHTENSGYIEKEKEMQISKEVEQSDMSLEEQKAAEALETVREDASFKRELDEALNALSILKSELDTKLEKIEAMELEVSGLREQKAHLEEQLIAEEQKSASAREKLNVAIRRGKGLVQQRDHLKQVIDETNAEMERLKTEIKKRDNTLLEYDKKVEILSGHQAKSLILESEITLLKNHLQEVENSSMVNLKTLTALLTALDSLVIGEIYSDNPVERIESFLKVFGNLEARLASSEEEAKESRQAAELLVAKLNDIQAGYRSLEQKITAKESEVTDLLTQKRAAETARTEALVRLENMASSFSEKKENQFKFVKELMIEVQQVRQACYTLSHTVDNIVIKEMDVFGKLESSLVLIHKKLGLTDVTELLIGERRGHTSLKQLSKVGVPVLTELSDLELVEFDTSDKDAGGAVNFESAHCSLRSCLEGIDCVTGKIHEHSAELDENATRLLRAIEVVEEKIRVDAETSDSLKRCITDFEHYKMKKENEVGRMLNLVDVLYEACSSSILQIEDQSVAPTGDLGDGILKQTTPRQLISGSLPLPSSCFGIEGSEDAHALDSAEEGAKMITHALASAIKSLLRRQSKLFDESHREMAATISHLQKELQEKDVQMKRICGELVSQIKHAEALVQGYLAELNSAKSRATGLEENIQVLENTCQSLKVQVDYLKGCEDSLKELQVKIGSFTDILAKKDQEIEGLLQALDAEEVKIEDMVKKVEEMEKIAEQKDRALTLEESSRTKAVEKLLTTVAKFDELHNFSEGLLSEIEKFQVQLQNQDDEISILRKEVTRCTNESLAMQESNKMCSSEINNVSMWLEALASQLGVQETNFESMTDNKIHSYMELLDGILGSYMSELETLRISVDNSDSMIRDERSRVVHLLQKIEVLENSLKEKDSEIELISAARDPGQSSSINTVEALEGQRNKVVSMVSSVTPHVRNVRKGATDHIALAIDTETKGGIPDQGGDDKGHDFKSLTTSRLVPRITRSLVDKIDGLWVSGGRMLMRQPTLRLGVITYWLLIHVMLVSSFI